MNNGISLIDSYKLGHGHQLKNEVHSLYTAGIARSSRIYGRRYIFPFLIDTAFSKIKESYMEWAFDKSYSEKKALFDTVSERLGGACSDPRFDELRDYIIKKGRLPIRAYSTKEGRAVPLGTPFLSVIATKPFEWFGTFIETELLSRIWHPTTCLTTAFYIKKLLVHYSLETCDDNSHIPYQAHDFSARGHTSPEAALNASLAHLMLFSGTDNVNAAIIAEHNGISSSSIPATEHSVSCSYGPGQGEFEYLDTMLNLYSNRMVSIVAGTYDYFNFLTVVLASRVETIKQRDFKVVIRPDSGVPENIICGDPSAPVNSPEWLGTIRILDNLFGSTVNKKGYKVLNPVIGCIYGDGINIENINRILRRLASMGYASSNIVFGIGAYTYQGVTRGTYNFDYKTSYYETKDGSGVSLVKDPKTDPSKRSQEGLIGFAEDGSTYIQEEFEELDRMKSYYSSIGAAIYYGRPYMGLFDIKKRVNKHV